VPNTVIGLLAGLKKANIGYNVNGKKLFSFAAHKSLTVGVVTGIAWPITFPTLSRCSRSILILSSATGSISISVPGSGLILVVAFSV